MTTTTRFYRDAACETWRLFLPSELDIDHDGEITDDPLDQRSTLKRKPTS